MGSAAVASTLARTNLYFALSHEVHLKALLAFAKLITLERDSEASRDALPAGFVFPLDAIVALTGGVEEDGGATLIRFVGKDDFFRIDPVSEVSHERVVRTGHAVFIDHGTWMRFGSQWPTFLESMIDFTQGRNALAILNATCCSNHRYPKRLARLLLEARRVFPAKDDWLPLTQNEIALLMNTRRETIALEMIELAKAGIVETGRAKFRILDPESLRGRACACYDKGVALAEHQVAIAKRMFAAIPPVIPSATPPMMRR